MIRFSSLSQSLYVHNKIGCTSENNIFKMCFNADNFLSGLFVVCLIYKKKILPIERNMLLWQLNTKFRSHTYHYKWWNFWFRSLVNLNSSMNLQNGSIVHIFLFCFLFLFYSPLKLTIFVTCIFIVTKVLKNTTKTKKKIEIKFWIQTKTVISFFFFIWMVFERFIFRWKSRRNPLVVSILFLGNISNSWPIKHNACVFERNRIHSEKGRTQTTSFYEKSPFILETKCSSGISNLDWTSLSK